MIFSGCDIWVSSLVLTKTFIDVWVSSLALTKTFIDVWVSSFILTMTFNDAWVSSFTSTKTFNDVWVSSFILTKTFITQKHRIPQGIRCTIIIYSSFLRLLKAHSTSRKLTATHAARMINSIAPAFPSSTNIC